MSSVAITKKKKAPYKARLKLKQPGVRIVGSEMYLHALESAEPLKYCVKFLNINYDTAMKNLGNFMENNPSVSENITLEEIISYEKLQDYQRIKDEANEYSQVLKFYETEYALSENQAFELIGELIAQYGDLEITGYQEAKQKKEKKKPFVPSEPEPVEVYPLEDISCSVDNAMKGMQADEDDYKAVNKEEPPKEQPQKPAENRKKTIYEKKEIKSTTTPVTTVKKPEKDNTEALKNLAKKLKEARVKSNMSQNRLAQLIGTKFPSNIKKWEEGTTTPSLEMLERLAKAVKMPPNYFEKEIDALRKMENLEEIKKEDANIMDNKKEMNTVTEKKNEEASVKEQEKNIQVSIAKPILERVVEKSFIDYLKAPFANKGIVINKIDNSVKIITEYITTRKYSSLKDLIQAVKDIRFVLNHVVEGNGSKKNTAEYKKMLLEMQTAIDSLSNNVRMPAEPTPKEAEEQDVADENETHVKTPEETTTEEILNNLNEKEKYARIRYWKADRAHAELVSAYPCVQDEKELQVLKDAAEILRQKRDKYKADMATVSEQKKELNDEIAKAMKLVQQLGYKVTKE